MNVYTYDTKHETQAVRQRDEAKKGGALSAHRHEMVSKTRDRHEQVASPFRLASIQPTVLSFADFLEH